MPSKVKQKNTLISILSQIFIGLILFTVIGFPKQVFFSIWSGKFLFFELTICLACVCLCFFFLNKNYINFLIPKYVLACLGLIIYLVTIRAIAGVDNIFSEGLLLIIYSAIILLFSHNVKDQIRSSFDQYLSMILIVGLFQEMLSMAQITGLVSNDFSKYIFGGTLGNPNILSIYLAPIIVLAVGLFLFQKCNRLKRLLASLVTVFGLAILLYASCRTACLSVFVSISVLIFFRIRQGSNRKIKGIWFLSGTLVLVLLVSPFLYQFRPESVKGRIWIWKIAWEMFLDKPFFGHGFGNFEKCFANYQVAYFSKAFIQDEYLYNADHITQGFNDLLQFVCETGILGLSLLTLILIGFFKSNSYKKVIASYSSYYLIICTSLLSLALCSLSYFPFSIIPVVTLTVILLFLLSLITEKPLKRKSSFHNHRLFRMFIILTSLSILIKDVHNLISLRTYSRAEKMYKNSNWKEAFQLVTKVDDYTDKNAQASIFLGQILERNALPSQAIDYYEKAYVNSSNYRTALRLGICYLKTNQYHKAKDKLEFVRLQIPYLLRPKIFLMQLFHKMGDRTQAIKMANEIIKLKVKIEDARSNKIKKSAINYLKRINHRGKD